jgi:lipopolysaccharide/colanic/teichoic acid biosynthesis glycosyltransferase
MSAVNIGFPYENDWIRKFNPSKRLLTGKSYRTAKRLLDLFIVIFFMPFWAPLMVVVACAILVTSSRPVFFVQQRTGKNGRRFRMYKFRTMVKNAEALKKDLAKVNASGDLAGPLKLENDPRVTKLGKILRKTSLDELPQLINVLLGNMSLVGPRPTSWSSDSYKLWHTERLDVLPGITGLWQVFGRGGQDFDEWLRLDIAYIERASLWLDIVIMYKTISSVLKYKGAR